jgi:uncharacterized protein YcbK (DUF882 family)
MYENKLLVIGIILLVVLIILLFSMLYSPAQYKKLSELYHSQKAADDVVYEGINTSKFRRYWFKLTHKGVGHYYG